MCWRNGGCFIKVGQHIGALEYLVPREYTDTMKVLHRYAPESPISELQSVFHEDFGQGVDELFLEFDEKPVASASLAQVHRATRRSDGMTVAVKVQHPRVKAHAAVDMATMEVFTDVG
jgi:aarF domain-containing kinase